MATTTPLETAARAWPCPYCNAAAGERCLTRYGTNRTYSHPERYERAGIDVRRRDGLGA